jgi:hypothetical protein
MRIAIVESFMMEAAGKLWKRQDNVTNPRPTGNNAMSDECKRRKNEGQEVYSRPSSQEDRSDIYIREQMPASRHRTPCRNEWM